MNFKISNVFAFQLHFTNNILFSVTYKGFLLFYFKNKEKNNIQDYLKKNQMKNKKVQKLKIKKIKKNLKKRKEKVKN